MSQLKLDAYASRKPLKDLLNVPDRVQSVYSLTQHVWAGESDDERRTSRKTNKVRLETLDEFFLDPVRGYLSRIFERIAQNEGQGFWVQAEFGVGKSHLLAATAVMALGGPAAWEEVKKREAVEGKAGPGARLDALWRKKLEKRRLFPIVFSLEGFGGGHQMRLEDFILEEAQATFALREGKPLAVYPEEHLARLFLKEHQKAFKDELRGFLADERLTRGLPQYDYEDFLKALQNPHAQRDAGRVLTAFYRHKKISPHVPTERGERLGRAMRDVLEAGYDGVFIAIDEMSEYLRRSNFQSDDEDCLLTLSSTLAKAQALPVWTLVAAQSAHSNPRKIIGPDRLREELLEHKAERFRDIVVQRTRELKDKDGVDVYFAGLKTLVPWVKNTTKEDFESCFPFPPDAIDVIRNISTKLTGTRSTISFLHRALQKTVQEGTKELVPLWRVFDDLMSYNETPSTASTGAVSIRSKFRGEVAALEAAQATLQRITDGQLSRPQNRSRAERILNTLFLYHLAGVSGLTREQILDAVCDLKPNEDELEAQLGHYETILEEMRGKLRNQIRFREGRYEFVPKETGQYDDLPHQAAERLKADPVLFWQYVDRAMNMADPEAQSPFADLIGEDEVRQIQVKTTWHGQERTGRCMAADIGRANARAPEVDTHGNEDDFVVLIARRPGKEKQVQDFLKRDGGADPRLCVWAPADPTEQEKATLFAVLGHLLVADEHRETAFEKDGRREFRREAHRVHTALRGMYARGVARTARVSLPIEAAGDVRGALESMACKAMDTCYQSRSIDFGNRKFDAQGAVKLINGLVKLGKAVSEGDQLWSAVENFAAPLGLVRPGSPRYLDPAGSGFYQAIKKKIEDRGGAGLEVRTVYNWFTGYDPKDGQESAGLTRRLVDVYLLAMAQQGVVRISDKRGGWLDRATIAGIEFKPETLRGLSRIELPKALEDWAIFAPYLEVLTGKAEQTLGPKYDKASADEALVGYWERGWLALGELQQIESNLRELFRTLGKEQENAFEGLLLYWIAFAEEPRPEAGEPEAVFDALRRAVLTATGTADPAGLTSAEWTTFHENYRQLQDLRTSFDATSVTLLRAARLARAPLPEDGKGLKEVAKAQRDVTAELDHVSKLVTNPATVQTRLIPRLERLEHAYVPTYLDELMALDSIQGELDEAARALEQSPEIQVLRRLSASSEAKRAIDQTAAVLQALPPRLRRGPEDRDLAARDVRDLGYVRDAVDGSPLTLRKFIAEIAARLKVKERVEGIGSVALGSFAEFLRSPKITEGLAAHRAESSLAAAIAGARSAKAVCELLLAANDPEFDELAKVLKAAAGGKTPKVVKIGEFKPDSDLIWEKADIARVVGDFQRYLEVEWEEGRYIKIEK
jgi:hypothetical protein